MVTLVTMVSFWRECRARKCYGRLQSGTQVDATGKPLLSFQTVTIVTTITPTVLLIINIFNILKALDLGLFLVTPLRPCLKVTCRSLAE